MKNAISKITPLLSKYLSESRLAKQYEGFLGVDAMLLKNHKGQVIVHPCLEINVRQNMGILSIYLEKLIYPEKKGMFRIYYDEGKKFDLFSKEMSSEYPLNISENKITNGFYPVTDSYSGNNFGAYILIK